MAEVTGCTESLWVTTEECQQFFFAMFVKTAVTLSFFFSARQTVLLMTNELVLFPELL